MLARLGKLQLPHVHSLLWSENAISKAEESQSQAFISYFATDALWSQVMYFKVIGQHYLRWGWNRGVLTPLAPLLDIDIASPFCHHHSSMQNDCNRHSPLSLAERCLNGMLASWFLTSWIEKTSYTAHRGAMDQYLSEYSTDFRILNSCFKVLQNYFVALGILVWWKGCFAE